MRLERALWVAHMNLVDIMKEALQNLTEVIGHHCCDWRMINPTIAVLRFSNENHSRTAILAVSLYPGNVIPTWSFEGDLDVSKTFNKNSVDAIFMAATLQVSMREKQGPKAEIPKINVAFHHSGLLN